MATTPDPLRTLEDGTPCYCVDWQGTEHTTRCITLRSFAGVKGKRAPWLETPTARAASSRGQSARSQALREAFLAHYSTTGIVTVSARVAGIDRRTVQQWAKDDADFASRMDIAREESTDLLEQEARRRAEQGVRKGVYQGGQLMETITEYSDSLMQLMLKANRPAKYRENIRAELTGRDGGPIQTQVLDTMTDHETVTLRRILEDALKAQAELEPEPLAPAEEAAVSGD